MSGGHYKIYKTKLREEFSYRCVYCGTREPELGGSKSFHIDHYKPKSKFPELKEHYSNLLYACRDCNAYKSDYWPNSFEKLLHQVILNPREDEINNHIDQTNSLWKGKTNKGEWNIKKLRLTSEALIRRRKDRNLVEETIIKLIQIYEQAKQTLVNAKQQNASAVEIQNIEQDITDTADKIDALQRKIIGRMD